MANDISVDLATLADNHGQPAPTRAAVRAAADLGANINNLTFDRATSTWQISHRDDDMFVVVVLLGPWAIRWVPHMRANRTRNQGEIFLNKEDGTLQARNALRTILGRRRRSRYPAHLSPTPRLKALEAHGWTALPAWDQGEETHWVAVRGRIIDLWLSPGGLAYDENKYLVRPSGIDPEWLVLAAKHGFRLHDRYNYAFGHGRLGQLESWLNSRKPSRKALERKLDKFLGSGNKDEHIEDDVPAWLDEMGFELISSKSQMKTLGSQHGWCFGSIYLESYWAEVKRGDRIFFGTDPVLRKPICVHLSNNNGWYVKEASTAHNEEQVAFRYEKYWDEWEELQELNKNKYKDEMWYLGF